MRFYTFRSYIGRSLFANCRKMSTLNQRGALIVLEGCDRAGKTTQCKKIGKFPSINRDNSVYEQLPLLNSGNLG